MDIAATRIMAAVLNNLSPEINDRNIICIVSVLWPKLLLGDHWTCRDKFWSQLLYFRAPWTFHPTCSRRNQAGYYYSSKSYGTLIIAVQN